MKQIYVRFVVTLYQLGQCSERVSSQLSICDFFQKQDEF